MIILEYSAAFGTNTYVAYSLWKSQLLQKTTDKSPNEQTALCCRFFPGRIMNMKPQHLVCPRHRAWCQPAGVGVAQPSVHTAVHQERWCPLLSPAPLPSSGWLFQYHPVKHWVWQWTLPVPGSARVAGPFLLRFPGSASTGPLMVHSHANVELAPVLLSKVQSPGFWTLRKLSI